MRTRNTISVAIDVTAAIGSISGVGFHIIRLVEALQSLDSCLRFVLLFRCQRRRDLAEARERFSVNAKTSIWPVPFPHTRFSVAHTVFSRYLLPAAARACGCRVFHGPAHIIPYVRHVPTVVTIHDLAFFRHDLYTPELTAALRANVADSVRRANAVIALSEFTRAELADILGRTGNVNVIYGAGNYPTSAQRQRQDGDAARLQRLGIRQHYILYVGDFGVRKNVPYLVRAYAALRTRHSASAQLVLAGNSAAAAANLRALVEELRLPSEDVVLTGRVDDESLRVLYRNASAFALFSLAEGFTLVTLEAMSYGVPVVATRTSSIVEGTGDTAILVPLDEVTAAADGLAEALVQGPARVARILAGRRRAETFSWQASAQATYLLYQSLTTPPSARTQALGHK